MHVCQEIINYLDNKTKNIISCLGDLKYGGSGWTRTTDLNLIRNEIFPSHFSI